MFNVLHLLYRNGIININTKKNKDKLLLSLPVKLLGNSKKYIAIKNFNVINYI